MKLRLLVEITADADTVDAIMAMVGYHALVDVDPHDGYAPMEGRLVGAVPVDDAGEARALAADQSWTNRADDALAGR